MNNYYKLLLKNYIQFIIIIFIYLHIPMIVFFCGTQKVTILNIE